MNVLVYLVPVALMLGLIGLIAFLWSLKSGQYDDLDGAAVRVLIDDDLPPSRPSADIDSLAAATEIRTLALTKDFAGVIDVTKHGAKLGPHTTDSFIMQREANTMSAKTTAVRT